MWKISRPPHYRHCEDSIYILHIGLLYIHYQITNLLVAERSLYPLSGVGEKFFLLRYASLGRSNCVTNRL
ncbi:hypothetical protein SeMB42_g00388 [Synchytrium endobioticum]|uniref:Uncharacterized protein n=1 Tax=Synchytrium endobioticum TaxID=286115 RepID=A0A507DT80_9FUNG|nr:hypothetical protein SeMB42_g00388 [Synchytrium endobioticum]